ncbi:MAG: DNA polymerase III subunit delta [Anaerolineales bacterium]
MPSAPTVYIFHGDDEEAKQEAVSGLKNKLGDDITAQMNSTVLGTQSINFDELRNACYAAPFLAERRLVVLHSPTKHFSTPEARELLIHLLDGLPGQTALVLMENERLDEKHWLMKWSQKAGSRVFTKEYVLPKGAQMVAWIRERAKQLGGDITPQAAAALEQLVGNDKGAAQNELEKLAAYAGYNRPIESSDVQLVSLPAGEQGDFFALIDAIGEGNPAKAMQNLKDLMPERDLMFLFFSLVGHFRLLVQSRELVDEGRGDAAIATALKVHPYRAQRLAAQARRFSRESLEAVYARLLDLDEMVKTGKMEWEVALETFVAGLSLQMA